MPVKTRASNRKGVKVTDATEVSSETVSNDTTNQVDGSIVLKTKSLSKKRNKKKIKSTSFEAGKCTSKDGSAMDEAPYSKDLSTKEQCSSDTASDILLKPPTELNVLSDDEGPPEGLSFSDAKQQVMMEEEHVKQHLANVRKGIKRQRYQQNERYKLQKVQKQSTIFPKLSDEVLAKIYLQKTQRKTNTTPTLTKKRANHTKAKPALTDEHFAVRKLTDNTVPVAASYENAVQFRDSCYYGPKHDRISAQVMEGRRYKFTAPPSFTVH